MSRKSGTQYRDEWVGEHRPRCNECLRYFDTKVALKTMDNFSYDPFVLEKVIRPLAQEHGVKLWENVCGDCILRLADKEREAVEWKPDEFGHYILSPDEERHGRMEERTGSIMARGNTKEQAPEAAAAEAPAEETAPKETAEQRNARVLKEKVDALAADFPEGTLVEVTAKGSEFVKNQGKVVGVAEKRGVPYLDVAVEVYATGRRRNPAKQFSMRAASVQKIDGYKDEPAAAAPAPAASDDGGETS